MGVLQDFLKRLKENNKPESTEDLYDERAKDRELLLLRRAHRQINEQEEKEYLKKQLRLRQQQQIRENFYGIKDNSPPKTEIIRALHNKRKGKQPSGYLGKYNLKGKI